MELVTNSIPLKLRNFRFKMKIEFSKIISMRFYLIILLFFSCTHRNEIPDSNHYSSSDDLFFNPTLTKQSKSLFDLLKWQFTGTKANWPDWVELRNKPNFTYQDNSRFVQMTFINHSTFYIQTPDLKVLTDPVFSERTSPVDWIGPKRVHSPGARIDSFPKVDIVIISHNHYDHLDEKSLIDLERLYHPLFLCPLGDKKLLKEIGLTNIQEMDWWNTITVNNSKITFTPTQHWSRRGLFDTNKSLWGSFVLETTQKKIYFAGDTGYSSYFKEIYSRFGAMDISLLPIGAYAPRWFMQDMHMDPQEAIWAHHDLMSAQSIATHFGTFQLTDEARDEPDYKLNMYLKSTKELHNKNFHVMEPGETRKFY